MFSFTLPKSAGGYELIGRSRAADATCISIPALTWMLDCGAIVQNWRPETVFITHTHSDHANRVTHVVSRRKPPTIYVPEFAAPLLEGYINAHQAMTDNRTLPELIQAMEIGAPEWQINRKVIPVSPGENIELKKGGKDWLVEVVSCHHSVACVGYAFREKRRCLKEKYQGLPGKELGALRKAGEDIHEDSLLPRFVFMGDTQASVFLANPSLLEFPVIITECSFFSEEHLECAERTKHSHWKNLRAIVESSPSTLFILIHFSLRYSNSEIIDFFKREALENVVPFVSKESSSIWLD